jgi:Ca-activated chloride channel family protein
MSNFRLAITYWILTLSVFFTTGCVDDKTELGGQEGEPYENEAAEDHTMGGIDGDDSPTGGEGEGEGEGDTDTDTDVDSDTDWGDEDDPDESDDGTDTGDTGDTGVTDCEEEGEVVFYLSPDDSNSSSSAAQARDAVLGTWTAISNVNIRTHEFMNYYGFDYERPEGAEAIKLTAQMVRDPDAAPGAYDLQLGLASRLVTEDSRAPMNITLVLDTSGSMGGLSMDMLKVVSREIAGELKVGDVISAVVWDTAHATLLDSLEVSGPDDSTLLGMIDGLSAGGGTDLSGGLSAGYGLATTNFNPERINRIVLISDGGANVGITDEAIIAEHAGDSESDGIYMVGVGVGSSGSYNDDLMDDVTDAGKGASVFISSAEEAAKVFDADFINTMGVAARNVQVALELPNGFEIVKFSGEEYSTDPTEIEPQHISPNDAMVFLQTIQTCAPESISGDTPLTVRVQYLDATSFEAHEITSTVTFAELLDGEVGLLRKGQAVFAYAEGLKAYQQATTPEAEAAAISTALAALARAEAEMPSDAALIEIRQVLEALE